MVMTGDETLVSHTYTSPTAVSMPLPRRREVASDTQMSETFPPPATVASPSIRAAPLPVPPAPAPAKLTVTVVTHAAPESEADPSAPPRLNPLLEAAVIGTIGAAELAWTLLLLFVIWSSF
jgi:hypothetical protein